MRHKSSNRKDSSKKNKLQCKINDEIRAREVRCIDSDGKQVGVMSLDEALNLAEERGLDLVEVSPNADPPVCRIMDYGKYKYQKSKKDSSKKKQKGSVLKEVKFRPKIDKHDYNFKKNHILRFLKSGAKVRVTIMFRGREMAHVEKGKDVLDRIRMDIEELARVDVEPKLEGRNMYMIVSPK